MCIYNRFNVNNEGLSFIKEKLNKKDRVLACGLENEDYAIINKSGYYLEGVDNTEGSEDIYNKYMQELNNFCENGNSFKEICFLGSSIRTIRDISQVRELCQKAYDSLGVNGYIVFQVINYDKFVGELGNESSLIEDNSKIIIPIWKEDISSVLKVIGFKDIEIYGSFNKEKFDEISSDYMLIRGRKHIDLLKDSPDYEEYCENVVKAKSCGGCCRSKNEGNTNNSGCVGCTGCSGGCKRH